MIVIVNLLLMLHPLWLLMAIFGGIGGSMLLNKGDIARARVALWVNLVGCVCSALVHIVLFTAQLAGGGGVSIMSMVMLGLWGFFTYRAITLLQRFS